MSATQHQLSFVEMYETPGTTFVSSLTLRNEDSAEKHAGAVSAYGAAGQKHVEVQPDDVLEFALAASGRSRGVVASPDLLRVT